MVNIHYFGSPRRLTPRGLVLFRFLKVLNILLNGCSRSLAILLAMGLRYSKSIYFRFAGLTTLIGGLVMVLGYGKGLCTLIMLFDNG